MSDDAKITGITEGDPENLPSFLMERLQTRCIELEAELIATRKAVNPEPPPDGQHLVRVDDMTSWNVLIHRISTLDALLSECLSVLDPAVDAEQFHLHRKIQAAIASRGEAGE